MQKQIFHELRYEVNAQVITLVLKTWIKKYLLRIIPKIVTALLALVMVPLYLEAWDQSGYALYVVLMALGGLANIVSFPMAMANLKEKSPVVEGKTQEPLLIPLIAICSALMIVLLLPVLRFYLWGMGVNIASHYYAVVTLLMIVTGTEYLLKMIYAKHSILNKYSLIELTFILLKVLLSYAVSMIWFSSATERLTVFLYAYCLFGAMGIATALYVLQQRVQTPLNFQAIKNLKDFLKKRGLGQVLFAAVVTLDVLVGTFDKVLLKSFSNVDLVKFSLALTVMSAAYIIPTAINEYNAPKLIAADIALRKQKIFIMAMIEMTASILVLVIGFALFGIWFLKAWLDLRLDQASIDSVYIISMILFVGAWLNSIGGLYVNVAVGEEKEKWILVTNLVFSFSFVVGIYWGYVCGGLYYAAAGFSLSYLIRLILLVFFKHKGKHIFCESRARFLRYE